MNKGYEIKKDAKLRRNLFFEKELLERASVLAKKERRNLNAFINHAVDQYICRIESESEKIGIQCDDETQKDGFRLFVSPSHNSEEDQTISRQ